MKELCIGKIVAVDVDNWEISIRCWDINDYLLDKDVVVYQQKYIEENDYLIEMYERFKNSRPEFAEIIKGQIMSKNEA